MNRPLYRSRTDTILGGVASGLAGYLKADPALVRLAWAILVPLTGGAALIAYVVAWIVVPEEPKAPAPQADVVTVDAGKAGTPIVPTADASSLTAPEPVRSDGRAGILVGIGLVVLGAWFLLRDYLPDFNWGLMWPLIIAALGVLMIVNSVRRGEGRPDPSA